MVSKLIISIFLWVVVLTSFVMASAEISHPASDVKAGTFGAGGFTFPSFLIVSTYIKASDWSNVTITESQITDLVHTTDTNESAKVNALVNTDCGAGWVMIGVNATGGVVCVADADTDTDTNESINVAALLVSNTTQAQAIAALLIDNATQAAEIDAISSFTDTNESTRFDVLVATDCGAGDLVIGINNSGGVVCVADTDTDTNDDFYWGLNSSVFVNQSTNLGVVWSLWTDRFYTEPEVDAFITTQDTSNATQATAIANNLASITSLDVSNTTQATALAALLVDNATQAAEIDAISSITDTNESTRFNVLVGTDCGASDFVRGINDSGGVVCGADQTTAGGDFYWGINTTVFVNQTNKLGIIESFFTNRFYTETEVDTLLAAQDECSEITGCVENAITNDWYWGLNTSVFVNQSNNLGIVWSLFSGAFVAEDTNASEACTDGNFLEGGGGCTDVLEETELDDISELNAQISDATILISGGTLTSAKWCVYDGAGIDCNVEPVADTNTWNTTTDMINAVNETGLSLNFTQYVHFYDNHIECFGDDCDVCEYYNGTAMVRESPCTK